MTRAFQYPGEWLVQVKGGRHFGSGQPITMVSDLGMAQGPVTFMPKFYHRPMNVDDYGPNVPAAVQTMMSEVDVSMTLIHFDANVLDICMDEAMGGGGFQQTQGAAGFFTGQGKPLDGGRNIFMSGNHMISLNLFNIASGQLPIRVRSTYLADRLPFPLGTDAQAMQVTFKGLPYLPPLLSGGAVTSGGVLIDGVVWRMRREMVSSGAVLWDHEQDTDLPDDSPFVETR